MNEIVAQPLYLDDEREHVLRFSLGDESRDVVLSDSNGVADLKDLFQWIIRKMIYGEIKVRYKNNPAYKNEMYSNVCEEYVKSLEGEIEQVFQRMCAEGLVEGGECEVKHGDLQIEGSARRAL